MRRPFVFAWFTVLLVASSFVRRAHAQDAASATDATAPPTDAASAGTPAVGLVPPVCIQHARPVYPLDADGRRVDVELLLTVDEHGDVVQSEILDHHPHDVPESFDVAARQAARDIHFRPALRDGEPIMVRLRYHMAIVPPLVPADAGADASGAPPEVETEIGGGVEGLVHTHVPLDAGVDSGADAHVATSPAPAPAETAAPTPAPAPPESGVSVRAVATRGRTASEFVLPVGALANVPRTNGSELLSLAPGVWLQQESTEGHANQVFLRGFTGDNGQDIAFSVDGVPLNEESNPHGQGYADLFFIIPELVERLDVTEGVADPRQGNFAVAGSIDYHLALRERGVTLRGTTGMFGYDRLTALWGPSNASDQTFVGLDFAHSDGYGVRRGFDRASANGQVAFDLGAGLTARVFAAVYGSRWDAPGVVREDDVQAGRIDFYGSYPSVPFQGGFSSRALAAAALDWHRGPERAEARVFAQLRDLTINENFTGYVAHPVQGDLVQQRYDGGTVGANGYYRRSIEIAGRTHDAELGWFLRHDRYSIAQQQLDARTATPLVPRDTGDTSGDARVTNLALYGDLTARILAPLTLRGGLRVDAFAYDVDREAFDTVLSRFDTRHVSAYGMHAGPKGTVELALTHGLVAIASVGTGLRSPDALTLTNVTAVPFATVTGEEIGLRYTLPPDALGALRLSATLSGFHTFVDNDLVFDPTQGESVLVGPTRRLGVAAWVRAQPVPWIDLNASFTYTNATALATALSGTLLAGSDLPYIPVWVGRIDAAFDRVMTRVAGTAIRARGGVGLSAEGPRALLFGGRTEPVFLLDAGAGLRVGPVALDLSAKNLLDTRWRDAQFEFPTNFVPGTTPSLVPTRVFTAGAPFTLFATLSLYL